MTFHPKMAYDAAFHKSARALEDEGPPFVYTAENRARFDEIVKRYPPDRRCSAVLPALYLAQDQQGYITANAIRHVAGLLDTFEGGTYHGKLIFPSDFPFKPPSIFMLTPNGRFEVGAGVFFCFAFLQWHLLWEVSLRWQL